MIVTEVYSVVMTALALLTAIHIVGVGKKGPLKIFTLVTFLNKHTILVFKNFRRKRELQDPKE